VLARFRILDTHIMDFCIVSLFGSLDFMALFMALIHRLVYVLTVSLVVNF